jgi:SAM-dependent methyltransferase
MSASTPSGRRDSPPKRKPLSTEDLAFLAQYLKVEPSDSLRNHVYAVWGEAWANQHMYRCIERFMFLHPRVAQHPYYPKVLQRIETGSQYLELGAAFGTDVRKLILDGWPVSLITAIDILPAYWNYGLELFKETAEELGVKFISTNVIAEPSFCLVNQFSVISLAAVLHVLSKEDTQAILSKCLTFLIPGGCLFGSCVGAKEPTEWYPTPDGKARRFLHSKQSLARLLETIGFTDVTVQSSPRYSTEFEEQIESLSFNATK